VIAIELTAAIDSAGTLATFYLSDDRLATRAGDTPANTAFEPAIRSAGSIKQTIFGDGRTAGSTKLASNEVRIDNADGRYDAWLNYSFDGRPLVIRRGNAGDAYPSAWSTVFTGAVDALTVTRKEVTIRLRDKQLIFDRAVSTDRYGGTNVLPAGIDGTPDDLAGKAKPRVLGRVLNIAPPCVNTSKLVYQPHNGQLASVDAVYDQCLALTFGADHADAGALLAATVAAGAYDTCLAEGLIRLGSSPAGEITCDVAQGASAVDRTAAALLLALALEAGVDALDIADDDAAALAADAPAELGIWLSQGNETFASVMDQIAASVGGFYLFDPAGSLRMGRLNAPVGVPVLAIAEYDVAEPFERRPARDGDVPIWRVTIRHSRVYTVQTSDIAGAVTTARRALVAQEYRAQVAENPAVKTQYLLAGEEAFDTLLVSEADAANEAARRLALRGVRRNFYDLGVPASLIAGAGLKLSDLVTVTYPRLGLAAGPTLVLLGIEHDYSRNRATLTLWG